jgi:peptidyl-prolyl cis-trans isomerase D
MFDLVKNSKILVGIILGLLAIPFAFFGVDYYFRGGGAADAVAEVGGTRISAREFSEALQRQQDQIRAQMQGRVDMSILDSPQVREAVMNQLIDERVAYAAAVKHGITVGDAELRAVIAATPAFREGGGSGAFSPQLYASTLRAQGMSEAMYESLLRKNLILSRALGTGPRTGFMPAAVVERLSQLRAQEREVSQVVFAPAQFAGAAKLDPGEARAYYDAHKAQFTLPEKVKVEFAILTLAGIEKTVQVAPEEVKKAFEERRAQLETAEERRARHILIEVPAGASDEVRAKAKARAQVLLEQVRAAPASFASVAKAQSQDPGSAVEGGDLGFFPRGKMVKPFDDALFALKRGEIAGPVETQYGYHIILLEETKAPQGPSFDAVKGQIEAELRNTHAHKRFVEAAETFSNLVYEQPDSLQPAVEPFELELQKSGWITRESADPPLLNNEKFLRVLFADDSLKARRNTEAVEIAPNMLVAARVVEHEPAKERPFAEVEGQILARLTQDKAAQLAKQEGQSALAKLRAGDQLPLAWSGPQRVTRERRAGLHAEAAQAVFGADVGKLPAYTGVSAPDGRYVIYRITKVLDGAPADPELRRSLARQAEQGQAQAVADAILRSWKKDTKISVNRRLIDKDS